MHRRRLFFVAGLWALLACKAAPGPDVSHSKDGPRATERTPGDTTMTRMQGKKEAIDFVAGPDVDSVDELGAWFEDNAKSGEARRRFRIPVVAVFEDEYRLALGDAFIGRPGDVSGDTRLRLHLDDGGLGVALLDTVRARCPKEQPSCALWLEGYWGMLVEMPDWPMKEGTRPFAVLAVGESIASGEAVRPMMAKP